jgi:intein-encoded DNA endonuclease-like protein
MKIVDKIGNIWIVYSNLCDLRRSYIYFEDVLEDIYDVNVLKRLDKYDFIDITTLNFMHTFINKFIQFIEKKEYRKDRVFVYLDSEFISILDNELKDFLEAFNSDLLRAGFTDVESLEVEEREFPTNEAILERVEFLYELMNKKRR